MSVAYTAISYCWGSPDHVAELSLPNGQDLRITRAVDDVVHSLVDRGGYFWIDFLSINQDGLDEKAEQVGFMGIIFSHSKEVDVWLGKEIVDGEAAIEFLTKTKSVYGNIECYDDLDVVREWQQKISELGSQRVCFGTYGSGVFGLYRKLSGHLAYEVHTLATISFSILPNSLFLGLLWY